MNAPGGRGPTDRLLRGLLPRGDRSNAIRADLVEEYRLRRSGGPRTAAVWYLGQALSVVAWSWMDRLRGRPWVARSGDRFVADGLRVFQRSPRYAWAVVGTLGLSLSLTLTVLTAVRGILFRELPYPAGDRLVRIDRVIGGAPVRGGVSYPDFQDWRDRLASFDALAALTGFQGTYVAEGVAEIWHGRAVAGDLLRVLGLTPALGPGLGDADAGRTDRVMISHALWEGRFGRDLGVVGRTILLRNERWIVVGVLPRGFEFGGAQLDVLVPLPEGERRSSRRSGFLLAVGRLAPGASFDAARTEVATVVSAIDASTRDWEEGAALRRYADVEVARVRRGLWLFLGAVALVLVIACANVAGLALARTESRRQEFAIRASLGAGRGRLVGQLLAESVAVSLAGGLVGIVGAVVGVNLLLATAPAGLPRREAIQLDPMVLALATLLALAAGVASGILPALRGARVGTEDGFRTGASTAPRADKRMHELLVGGQVALAIVLLTGAALLFRSVMRLTDVDPGFQVDGIAVVEVGLETARYDSVEAVLGFQDALLERVRALPGVSAAGMSTHLPFSPAGIYVGVLRDGQLFDPKTAPTLSLEVTYGDYFRTLGIAPVRGRLPRTGGGREAVINEATAQLLWPGCDPLGERYSFDVEAGKASPPESFFTVVGVVPDVKKEALDEEPAAIGYYSLPDFRRQFRFISGRYFFLVVASEADPSSLIPAVRQVVAGLDPALPIRSAGTLAEWVRATTVSARFRALVLGVFATMAIAVSLTGVYAVMAYRVSRGVREIGIRMALGASAAGVRWRVLRRAAAVVAVGGAVGLVGALAAAPVLAGVLFRVTPHDPPTLLAVLGLTAAGSLLAAWLPALRASRVDPMRVLREE